MNTTSIRSVVLVLTITLAASGLVAQEPATPQETTAAPQEAIEQPAAPLDRIDRSSHQIREEFSRLLRANPPELGTILALDPTLLSNEAYLSAYPAIARFVSEHPEVQHNPRFYLQSVNLHQQTPGVRMMGDLIEGLAIFAVFFLITFALAWLVRTVIEQKRWNRLSKTQSEVHNKILDRFSTNDELLAYIRTPAGTRFLESAPIPLHSDQASTSAPISRILWSVQAGVIIAAGAVGMLLVSGRLEPEAAQGFFAMGTIALSVGAGFIISGFVSLFASRRLGLWQPPHTSEPAGSSAID